MRPHMKSTTVYTCTECDAQSPKWTGQCMECSAWGSLQASVMSKQKAAAATTASAPAAALVPFSGLSASSDKRIATGLAEADRVFGGGIVQGSVTLIGGEPGIGKSTIALMMAASVASRVGKTIYISGEESAAQVKLRADRLGVSSKDLYFLSETNVETLVATIEKERPFFAVIDSVQTLKSEDAANEAGTPGQVRTTAGKLVAAAKSANVPLLLIGHVTKDGNVAGPKTLEHVVDAVLSFEGERSHPLRTLRALKNRFGSTDETGIFEMTETGLTEIANPSAYLLDGRQEGVAGSALCCVMEGTRPIIVEVQALVQPTSFGYPARKTSGVDQSRVEVLLAVLGRRADLDFSSHDVYVNVVGGLKLREPAADLAIALALASALRRTPISPKTVAWGEVGLGGEVRPVVASDRRLQESAALGMTAAVAPRTSGKPPKDPKTAAIRVHVSPTITEAVAAMSKSVIPA